MLLTAKARRDRRNRDLIAVVLALFLIALPQAEWGDQRHVQDSARLMEQGDLTAAESQARMAINDPSSRALAYAILGAIRLRQAKYDESASFLLTALRLDPLLIGARLNLGNVYVLQGRSNEAAVTFREVLKLDPGNFNARFALARLESEAGHYVASMNLAKPIFGALRRSDEGLLLIASDDLALNNRTQLLGIEADWFALDDPAPAASLRIAQVFAGYGLFKEAISFLEHSEIKDGASFDLYFNLGGYYLEQGDSDQASANYKLALDVRQDCADCMFQLARIAEQKLNLDEALSYALRAKQYAPNNPDILFEVGRVCAKKNLYGDAIENLSAAKQLRPDNESFQYVLASAYTGKKEYKRAIPILEYLVSRHPRDPVLNYSLGAVQYLDSDLSEAEKHLELSITLDPNQIASYYYLGLTKNRSGETEQAAQILQSLSERHPDHAATFAALGEILFEEHKYSAAHSALVRAVQLAPSSVKAHYQLGMVLGRLGQDDASRREFAIVKTLNQEADEQSEMKIFSTDQTN
jgi:tetratricopeptide (TPR) repeat protein